jgi:hypothetical protein
MTALSHFPAAMPFRCALALMLLSAVFVTLPANAQGNPEAAMQVVGWVEIKPAAGKPDHIVIAGRVYGLSAAEGSYTLEIKRRDHGNASASGQQTAINIPPGSGIEVVLKLFAGDREVFSSVFASKP